MVTLLLSIFKANYFVRGLYIYRSNSSFSGRSSLNGARREEFKFLG